tara:strand:+ start:125 stop:442 length:318 start_codon:yes stop_codon:yes gene_type:complete
MTKKKQSKPFFPNNVDAITEAPSEYFKDCSFKDFMRWKECWELPSSHVCIIRATNKAGFIKEYSYRQWHHAEKRIEKLEESENITELLVVDDQMIVEIPLNNEND